MWLCVHQKSGVHSLRWTLNPVPSHSHVQCLSSWLMATTWARSNTGCFVLGVTMMTPLENTWQKRTILVLSIWEETESIYNPKGTSQDVFMDLIKVQKKIEVSMRSKCQTCPKRSVFSTPSSHDRIMGPSSTRDSPRPLCSSSFAAASALCASEDWDKWPRAAKANTFCWEGGLWPTGQPLELGWTWCFWISSRLASQYLWLIRVWA